MLSIVKHGNILVAIMRDVEKFCESCHRFGVFKLPYSIPLHVGKRVRRGFYNVGKDEIQDMFSDERYIVIRAPNMPGGPYVIRKVTANKTTLGTTGSESKLCEGKILEELKKKITLGLAKQPDVAGELFAIDVWSIFRRRAT